MLIVDLTYQVPLSDIEPHLKAHRDFLQTQYDLGHFIASGPKDPRTGGIIIALVDEQTMSELIAQDPFYIQQLANYTITVFNPVLHCPELATLI